MTSNPASRRIHDKELFRGCDRTQLQLVEQLGVTLDVAADRTLCTDGSPGFEFFVLLEGLVEVHTSAGRLALLHPGGWFGELALLDGGLRRATVATVTDSILLIFGKREFAALLAACPSVETCVQNSAESFNRGDVPDHEPWYQAIEGTVTHPVQNSRN